MINRRCPHEFPKDFSEVVINACYAQNYIDFVLVLIIAGSFRSMQVK